MNPSLPIFLENASNRFILKKIVDARPPDTTIYLFAGSIRNALTYSILNEVLPQNDFDLIIIGDGDTFIKNLKQVGFEFSDRSVPNQPSARFPRIANPIEKYKDWMYIDCKIYTSEYTVKDILAKFTDFSVSGVALDMTHIEDVYWQDHIYALPSALDDISHKRLRVVVPYPASLLKVVRMVAQGFTPPTQDEMSVLIESFKEISEGKYNKRRDKTIRYVGSTQKTIEIIRSLGLSEDILDFQKIIQL